MPESKAPLTQDERSEVARRALIDATVGVLAEEGFRRTTFSRIQDAAGISRGLIGYHFGSKTTLIETVIHAIRDRYQSDSAARAGQDLTGLESLRDMVDVYLQRLSRDPRPAQVMLVLATESIGETVSIRQAMQERFGEMRAELQGFIEQGLRDGTIRPGVDARGYAGVFQGVIRGIALQYLVDPDGFDLDAARRAALETVEELAAGPRRAVPKAAEKAVKKAVKKAAATKVPARKTAATKVPARKTAAKDVPGRKAAARKTAKSVRAKA